MPNVPSTFQVLAIGPEHWIDRDNAMRILLLFALLSGVLVADCQAQLELQHYGAGDVVSVGVSGSSMLVTRIERPRSHYSIHWLEFVNGTWQERGIIDEADVDFGRSIAVDGDWAAAGESLWNGRGRVRLYHRQGDGWERTENLELNVVGLRPDEAYFGEGVVLEYPWLVVRAQNFMEHEWGPSKGAIFFYEHVGGEWLYRMHLADPYASSYTVSVEENVAVVGPFIYRLQDDAWVQVAKLKTWTRLCGGAPISTDGERVAVARRARDCGLTQSPGAVYIYAPDAGGSWALQDSIVGPVPLDGNWGDRYIHLKGPMLTVEERVYVEDEDVWREVAVLRGSRNVSQIGGSIVHSSREVIGVTSNVYIFDITRSTEPPSMLAPAQGALLTGTDSLVIDFSWESLPYARGYVLVSESDYWYPRIIEELDEDVTTHTITYHQAGDGTSDGQFQVRWQVSALLEEGVGRPSVGAFDALIETSYVPPPPFGGFDLARFTPTGVGNRWEYRWTQIRTVDEDESSTTGYESFEILPDTTLGDSTFTVVRIQRFDDQRRLTQSKTCAYSATDRVILDSADEDVQCDFLYVLHRTSAHVDFLANQTVELMGVAYEVDALARQNGDASAPGGRGGGHWHYEWAADIGMLQYGYGTWGSGPPDYVSTSQDYVAELLFARVDGESYGQSVVRSEPEEQPRHAMLRFESLYPNPVDDVLHVRLNTPAPGGAVLEFFDVTGRRIHRLNFVPASVTTALTVDLPPGTSGVLLVRATDSAGNTARASVVRVAR